MGKSGWWSLDILLIDDDLKLGEMLGEYLKGEGYRTTLVANGLDGVEAALSGRHAAVILDVMLPGLGGVEVLRRIRQKSQVPVIMLTAKGDQVDRVVRLEMGADDYLPKPCYPRELVARLRAILRRAAKEEKTGSEVLVHAKLRLWPAQRRAEWDGRPLDLTVSEFNLLEALRRWQPGCRTLIVSSNEIYGLVDPADLPIDEETPFRPNSPYGVSKLTQDMMALQYFNSHHLPTIRARNSFHWPCRQKKRQASGRTGKLVTPARTRLPPGAAAPTALA
jgi:DNA-binding response OmpR family regulator